RDVAYTMQTGRDAMKERLAVVAQSPADLLAGLAQWLSGAMPPGVFRGSVRGKPVTGEIARAPERVAQLWAEGVEVDWALLHEGEAVRRISLPGYPFAP